jgi:hypothetical protein
MTDASGRTDATDQPVVAPVGESRWPMAIAVVVVMILSLFQSSDISLLPTWVAPLILEGGFLAYLLWADPGRIDRQTPRIRAASLALVGLILLNALTATALLAVRLTQTDTVTGGQAIEFVWDAARVWITVNIAFALLYWQLDSGGPVTRLYTPRPHPDFAFPQHSSPGLGPPGWRPTFLDYLYLGFTTGNAFSPTDTMPLVHWAKLAMGAQALITFVIVGLVVARLVNIV